MTEAIRDTAESVSETARSTVDDVPVEAEPVDAPGTITDRLPRFGRRRERPVPVATQPVPGARPARTVLGRRRVRARRVRRTIRHIDPWSVFKIAIIFCLCLYGALLLATSLLWQAAERSGFVENIESFFVEIGLFDTFEFETDVMFRAVAIGGLVLAVAFAALIVLMTVVFNLISDLMGGIRVSVIEEDVAYQRPVAPRPDGSAPTSQTPV